MADRMHMSATTDGRVVAVAIDDAGDHWVIDDGKVIPHGLNGQGRGFDAIMPSTLCHSLSSRRAPSVSSALSV